MRVTAVESILFRIPFTEKVTLARGASAAAPYVPAARVTRRILPGGTGPSAGHAGMVAEPGETDWAAR